MSPDRPLVHIIAGPTAGGKSARALELAAQKNGTIINADSMQIYDALPLLTAQPIAHDKSTAPHRLYGHLAPDRACSAQDWAALARTEIKNALSAEQAPIIVGGTGFYLKALMDGLSPIPDVPPSVRERAIALQQELGNPAFHAALAVRDPVMAARLHPNDTQRLIRSWEVFEATGHSLAHWQALPPQESGHDVYDFEIELILPERDTLYERCNMRFDAMMKAGVLEEVKAFDDLIKKGIVPANVAITHALGFRPLQSYLQGALSLEDAIEKAKAETRQYAKRQVTWFRHQIQ